MDDIHNEMRDEDIYIPLAVRIKLFEQNLRNGNPITTSSRSTGSTTHRQNEVFSLKKLKHLFFGDIFLCFNNIHLIIIFIRQLIPTIHPQHPPH